MSIHKAFSRKSDRKIYIEVLKRMTPEQRLQKAFELSETCKELLKIGLKNRYPDSSKDELHRLFLKIMDKCYNKNY